MQQPVRSADGGDGYAPADVIRDTDVAKLLAERGADLTAVDADGVTPHDAANGKLRGRGRGLATVYPATAKALEGLLDAAVDHVFERD